MGIGRGQNDLCERLMMVARNLGSHMNKMSGTKLDKSHPFELSAMMFPIIVFFDNILTYMNIRHTKGTHTITKWEFLRFMGIWVFFSMADG